MLTMSDMQGLWSRSLLVRPDATRDTTTWVAWLQGPTLFADLRQPTGRPSFAGVRALGDLNGEQIAWIAEQEGFAGRLEQDGEYFVWRRALDFQPPAATADSGRLFLDRNIMIEEGRYSPYIEHWERSAGPLTPCAAAQIRDRACGCEGYLVRVGAAFMYVRAGVRTSLPEGARLVRCLDHAVSLEAARELIDCEISFGRVSGAAWTIVRSSLPYREGAQLDLQLTRSEHRCSTADLAADGSSIRRSWDVVEIEGDVAALGGHSELDAESSALF